MTTRVRYTGKADTRVIRDLDFTRGGLTYTDVAFTDDNNQEIDLPDNIALFLLAQGEFVGVNGETFRSLLTETGGYEIMVVEFAPATSTYGALADVAGFQAAGFVVGVRPVYVELAVPTCTKDTANTDVLITICDEANVEKARCVGTASRANGPCPGLVARERISTPGTYTRKVRCSNSGTGGIVTIYGKDIAATAPPRLRVMVA